MPRSADSASTSPSPAGQMRRYVHHLRTEGGTPARDALAVAFGVFVGCSPWYGFHFALCWLLGWGLRLNRLKMYLAANISNPAVAPFLILGELQAGAWIRRGTPHALSIDAVRATDPWTFGADLVVGSLVVGSALGAALGLATWLSTRGRDRDPVFSALVVRASDRYVPAGITAWEFARGKMRGDPLYRTVMMGGLLPPGGGVLFDVGCGQGLMLALLAEAAAAWRSGNWPAALPPPVFDQLVGIETRARVASLARTALGRDATIVAGDARTHVPGGCRAVLFFDVLHMMAGGDQERLLRRMAEALDPGGMILVREADAAAGWRFQAVRAGNRLKALAFGNWRQHFHFRTAAEWHRCFADAGFSVDVRGAGEGTPFANVLFVLTRARLASA